MRCTAFAYFFLFRPLLQAIDWLAARTPQQIISEREAMIIKLEEASGAMWASGLCEQWFCAADDKIKDVSAGVNGPLFTALLRALDYVDTGCTQLLREGTLHSLLGVRNMSCCVCHRCKYGG